MAMTTMLNELVERKMLPKIMRYSLVVANVYFDVRRIIYGKCDSIDKYIGQCFPAKKKQYAFKSINNCVPHIHFFFFQVKN